MKNKDKYDEKFFFHFRHTPDDSNITVFNNGNSKGLIDCIPIGGH
jgi:hypothetical protein